MMDFLKKPTFWVIVFALLVGFYAYYPALFNPYIIADDVQMTHYWMYAFQDSDLFANDFITQQFLNTWSWGFVFVYYLISFIGDLVWWGNILSIITFAVTAGYMYKVGEVLSGKFLGILGAAMLVTSPTFIDQMSGGTPRIFAILFFVMFFYSLVCKKYLFTFISLSLQIIFSPFIFLVSIIIFLLDIIFIERGFKRNIYKKTLFFISTCFLANIVFFLRTRLIDHSYLTEQYVRAEMIRSPEFYHFGRWSSLLPIKPLWKAFTEVFVTGNTISIFLFESISKIFSNKFVILLFLFIVSLLILITISLKDRKLYLREVYLVMIAGAFMYKLADIFLFKFYLPGKHLTYPILIAGIMVMAFVIDYLLNCIKNFRLKRVLQVLIVFMVAASIFKFVDRSHYLADFSDKKDLYQFISTLPKSAMIASNPTLIDEVPVFSKRAVYVSYEISNPFYKGIWKIIKQRNYAVLNAYYSDNPLKMYLFSEQQYIDYWVVDLRDFHPLRLQSGRFYFQPFNEFVKELIKSRPDFIVKYIPRQYRLFEKDGIYVFHRDALLSLIKK